MEAIRVYVIDKGRRNLYMRYRCPDTGREEMRSTETANKKDAAKRAAVWEAELREGRYQRTPRMPWADFRQAYEDAKFPDFRPAARVTFASTLNKFEALCHPERVADLTTARVTAFKAEMRKEHERKNRHGKVTRYYLRPATINKHLTHLRAVAYWALEQKYLREVPAFGLPKRKKGERLMKGRPLVGEEFDRLLATVPKVVGDESAASWRFFLRGLWWSGLRLSEAMALRWDHTPGGVSVVLSGRQSVLRFDGDSQKSGKAQVVPMAPEFARLLESHQRDSGPVFRLGPSARAAHRAREKRPGTIISWIGAEAGIVTDPETGKTASAHDLRRSFGYRWSRRVMPATLKALMRHSAIETTMAYYVGEEAIQTAGELWDALGDTWGDTPDETAVFSGESAIG